MIKLIKLFRVFSIIILLFLVWVQSMQAQSYEGCMKGQISGNSVHLFVWFDLLKPSENEAIKGSYFYKNIGKEISVSGQKQNDRISLTEHDKNLKKTGFFLLEMRNNTLKGFWYGPDKKDSLQVVLFRTNPSFKEKARIPRLKDLLAEDIEFYSAGLDGNESEEGVHYSVLFAGCNIISIELNWENWGYTAHYGTIHYTYNLDTAAFIDLKQDITDSCHAFLSDALQKTVSEYRQEYSDSEWVVELHPYVEGFEYDDTSQAYILAASEKINELFTVSSLPAKAEIYLNEEGLNCFIEDYCEQYYSSGNRAMTFDCRVTIPFNKLKPFIKKKSVLMSLFEEHYSFKQ